jgi:endonuclease/exonuclease/phosphatase family metal-dependent hydrolase
LKVLSYNIQEGGRGRLRSIAALIRAQQPHVVALLEANSRSGAWVLAHHLKMELAFGRANGKFHVAWLSRLPIVRAKNHRLPNLAKTMLEIRVVWEGEPLRLFATHLAGGADKVHPAQEAPAVLDALRPFSSDPHLLVGDLNALSPCDPIGASPLSEEIMRSGIVDDPRQAIRLILTAGYLDCYRALHPAAKEPGYTFPADSAWLRLDYIFASLEMAARLQASGLVSGADAQRASDHFPVWAEFW